MELDFSTCLLVANKKRGPFGPRFPGTTGWERGHPVGLALGEAYFMFEAQ